MRKQGYSIQVLFFFLFLRKGGQSKESMDPFLILFSGALVKSTHFIASVTFC